MAIRIHPVRPIFFISEGMELQKIKKY